MLRKETDKGEKSCELHSIFFKKIKGEEQPEAQAEYFFFNNRYWDRNADY